jgi:hypothetical protein
MSSLDPNAFERWLKVFGVTLSLIGLLAGLYQFTRNQAVDAAKPFLERKLRWCEEVVEVTAGVAVFGRESTLPAVASNPPVRRVDRFQAVYWGVMGMVETKDITDAMNAFKEGLKAGSPDLDDGRAIAISHACRSEMARDWSSVWQR